MIKEAVPVKVCIATQTTVSHDKRTLLEAATLAANGLEVVIIGLCAKGQPPEENGQGITIKRISTSLKMPWGKDYPRYLLWWRSVVSLVFLILARSRRFRSLLTYLRLAKAMFKERADFYHAHFPIQLMIITWCVALLARRTFVKDYRDIITSSRPKLSTKPYYELEELWGGVLDSREKQRIEDTVGMIPPGVHSILDVGCGDGRITNLLASRCQRVVGVDISSTALQYVKAEKVLGTAERLPFPSQSFDLVLVTELLEHLPNSVYRKALEEMDRVGKTWIIVGVPWDEQLALGRARCPVCKTVFHVNHHCRRFNRRTLNRLFRPAFELVMLKYTGGRRRYYNPILLRIRQYVGGIWVRTNTTVCPKCGLHLEPLGFPERNAIGVLCDRINDKLSKLKKDVPSHVVALYNRVG